MRGPFAIVQQLSYDKLTESPPHVSTVVNAPCHHCSVPSVILTQRPPCKTTDSLISLSSHGTRLGSQTRTFANAVRWLPIHTLSVPSEPGESPYPGGTMDAGATSGVNSMAENCWRRRMSMKDASLYANCRSHVDCFLVPRPIIQGVGERTCWPRQIRGPALNGRKMKGLGVRYLCTRSSRNRSGSYFNAVRCPVSKHANCVQGDHTVGSP